MLTYHIKQFSQVAVKGEFTGGKGQIWLDQVKCQGNESGIDQCTHWQWGEHNCLHTEDVGVRCFTGPRNRLQRSSPAIHMGRDGTAVDESGSVQIERSGKSLDTDKCGEIKAPNTTPNNGFTFRVVDGGESKVGQHPWQAGLRVRGQGKSSHWCGASVISRYHILTAAHCLIGYPKGAYYIRVGDHNSEIQEDQEAEIFIENIYVHENFRKGQHMTNDIAMILLKSPIRYSNYIQPICLPPKTAEYNEGLNCTISGWGSIKSGKSGN